MKKFGLSVLAFCFCLGAFAQSKDAEKVKVSYMELPEFPFPSHITNYSAKVEIPYGLSTIEDREAIVRGLESSMMIQGYDKVSEDGQINVTSFYYGFSSLSPEHRTTEVEEKRGDTKVKVTYHYFTVAYKLPVKLEVSLNGKILEDFYVSNSQDFSSYTSDRFKSYNELATNWNKGRHKILIDLKNSALSSRNTAVNSHLNKRYGYRKANTTERFYTFKTKKFNYEDFDKAVEIAKEAFPYYSDTLIYPVSEFKVKIAEAIDIWNKALEESEVDNKKARVNEKITGLTLQNLAVSYIYLQDFENAFKCIEEGKTLGKGDAWVKYYEGVAKDRQEKLKSYEEAMSILAEN